MDHKYYYYGGGVAALVLVIYVYKKRHGASQSSSSDASSQMLGMSGMSPISLGYSGGGGGNVGSGGDIPMPPAPAPATGNSDLLQTLIASLLGGNNSPSPAPSPGGSPSPAPTPAPVPAPPPGGGGNPYAPPPPAPTPAPSSNFLYDQFIGPSGNQTWLSSEGAIGHVSDPNNILSGTLTLKNGQVYTGQQVVDYASSQIQSGNLSTLETMRQSSGIDVATLNGLLSAAHTGYVYAPPPTVH